MADYHGQPSIIDNILSRGQNGRDIMQMVWLEDLVQKNYLLRKIGAAVDFDKIYEMVEELN